MENRSFDHMLGWLKSALMPEIDGLDEGHVQPRDPNDLSKGFIPVTRFGYDVSPDDPKHDYDNVAEQINDNKMNGFISNALENGLNESNPVRMFDMASAPIINSLAMEFAVFDQWFCSFPGSTDPNRAFAMSGTSRGITENFNGTLYTQQSYFDYLREHGRSFAGYYQDDLWALGYFEDLLEPENSQFIKELEPYFFDDVAAGNLANFTWLQPRMSTISPDKMPTWQHPDASVREGEKLIKEIYEAIRAGPKWNETLFLITYDEHGGFYDHVAPPSEGVPSPDGISADNGFTFDQLGLRIPTLAISPWVAKGTLVSGAPQPETEQPTSTSAFDSTSTLATANILLGLSAEEAPPLSDRMAWANTFASIFDVLDEPRTDCPETLPPLTTYTATTGAAASTATSTNSEFTFDVQRAKPLNEHMEAQLLYFCVVNHPEEQRQGTCPGRPELKFNQGLASDWMLSELAQFKSRNFTILQ